VICDGCGLVFVNPQPVDPVALNAQLYGKDHASWEGMQDKFADLSPEALQEKIESLTRKQARKYGRELAFLETYRKQETLLDVGCSAGSYLLAARTRGWKVTGLEVAREIADVGRDVFGLDILDATLESCDLEEESFDVVRANQLIEHIQQPLPFLRAARRLLRPGGVLVLTTVNFRSWSRRVLGPSWRHLGDARNGHITFFTPALLRRTLKENGFKVARTRTVGFRLARSGRKKGALHRVRQVIEKAVGGIASLLGFGGRLKMAAVRRD